MLGASDTRFDPFGHANIWRIERDGEGGRVAWRKRVGAGFTDLQLQQNSPRSVLNGNSVVYCMPLLRTMGSFNAQTGALEWERTYTETGIGVGIPAGPFGGQVYNTMGPGTNNGSVVTKFADGGGDTEWRFWVYTLHPGGQTSLLTNIHIEGSTMYSTGTNLRLDPLEE